MATSTQGTLRILCPSCNGAQEFSTSENYQCAYCLTPFSVTSADDEQARLFDDLKTWVERTLGNVQMGQAVDAGARLRIFQKDILPLLRRDVNRCLEPFRSFGDSPVVISFFSQVRLSPGQHVMLRDRRQILQLKTLRSRLIDQDINDFAAGKQEQFALRELDHKLAQLIAFSNVSDACCQPDYALGYATAAKNFIALLTMVREMYALADNLEHTKYVTAHTKSYEALATYCLACENVMKIQAPQVPGFRAKLDEVILALSDAMSSLESCTFEAMHCMNLSMLLQHELQECNLLNKWLVIFEGLHNISTLTFPQFLAKVGKICSKDGGTANYHADRAAGLCHWLQVACGLKSAFMCTDTSWLDNWVASIRKKRWLGLIGTEERIVSKTAFLVPVWLATVEHATTQSKLFSKDGFEDKSVVLISACRPWTGLMSVHPVGETGLIKERRSLKGQPLILPESTASEAEFWIMGCLSQQFPNLNLLRLTAQPELIYLPAAEVTLAEKTIERKQLGCAGGDLSLGSSPAEALDMASRFVQSVVNVK